MELENIVANTVYLKAREGKQHWTWLEPKIISNIHIDDFMSHGRGCGSVDS